MTAVVKVDTINGCRGLTGEDDRIDLEVPGLEGVRLFPHQAVVLARLKRIAETSRVETEGGVIVSTNCALLSLALGGGKTFCAIALYLMCNPRQIPGILGTPHHMRITYRYGGDYVLIQPALVVAAPQVIEQWKSVIERHTKLLVFTVSDYYDLKKLVVLIRNKQINSYNIILAKAGMVSGNDLEIPGEPSGVSIRNMISAIAAYTAGMIWKWFFIDDYDTAELGGVRSPHALFTLYISATCSNKEALSRDKPLVRTWTRECGADPIAWLRTMQPRIMDSIHDPHLIGPLSVQVSAETLAKMQREGRYELPAYLTYVVTVQTTDSEVIRLIEAMGGNGDIVNALNGEAVATAAASLNIKARGAADVLSKLLDDKREAYSDLIRRALMLKFMMSGSGCPPISDYLEEHPGGEYTEAQLASHIKRMRKIDPKAEVLALRNAVRAFESADSGEGETKVEVERQFAEAYDALKAVFIEKTRPKSCPTLWYSEGLVNAETVEASLVETERAVVSRALEGLRDNFRAQRCGVCKLDYDPERPLFINKCCGAINCMKCGIKCNRFSKQYNHRTAKVEFFGNCASCGRRVNPSTDMIFVEKVGSLEMIMDGAMITDEEIVPTHVSELPSAEDTLETRIAKLESPKCRSVIRILKGLHVECQQIDRRYDGVIEGSDIRLPPAGARKKVIIFADLDESTSKVTAALQAFGVGYDIVGGTPSNIAAVLRDFEENPAKTALVVNSCRNSSGMNLDVATDIIFFHSITDPRRLSQAVARAQRFGRHRQYSLRIWFILNDNENTITL